MPQFFKENLFVVVAVSLTMLALAAVALPIIESGAARETALKMAQLKSEVARENNRSESPRWNEESRTGISRIRQEQESVIETALRNGARVPLLVKDELVFPNPDLVQGARLDFQLAYTQSFAQWLTELEAGSLPTDEELAPLLAKELMASRAKPGGSKLTDAQVRESLRAKETELRARKYRLWAREECFDNYIRRHNITTGQQMTDEQLWEALLNWWVQKDVVEAMAAVNTSVRPVGQAAGVPHSPIKELSWIRVDRRYYRGGTATAGTGSSAGPSGGVLTNHITCPKYHVLHYGFQVIMDVKDLPLLVGALSSRNFHTVLSLRYDGLDYKGTVPASAGAAAGPVTPVGPVGAAMMMPEYGAAPVMVVTLHCEAVFMLSPPSWRGDPEEGRKKKLAFLRKRDDWDVVTEIHRVAADGRSQRILSEEGVEKDRREVLDKVAKTPGLSEKEARDKTELGRRLASGDPDLRFLKERENWELILEVHRVENPGAPAKDQRVRVELNYRRVEQIRRAIRSDADAERQSRLARQLSPGGPPRFAVSLTELAAERAAFENSPLARLLEPKDAKAKDAGDDGLRFLALYEDLIPQRIKEQLPGLSPAAASAGPVR